MVLVGLTGLMGSGKSTILNMFKELNADIYNADVEAKRLMHTPELSEKIVQLFGTLAYKKGNLDRTYIANIVFNDSDKLKTLNSIVHPAVRIDFERFIKVSTKKYIVYESALLLRDKLKTTFDFIAITTAPVKLRFERILKRDDTNSDQIMKRLKHQQISDSNLESADFIIENLDINTTKSKVLEIHKAVLAKIELTKE